MNKKKPVAYCSLEPFFPTNAYLLFLFIIHEEQAVGMIPLDAIYESPEEAANAVQDVIKQLGKTNHITVSEEALLMPITFQSLYPMKREFWGKPTISYDQQLRVKAFSAVAHYPSLHALLVTPYVYDDAVDTWHFSATLPLLSGREHTTIERFMYTSDQIVEPRAKYSAIYTIGDKMQFNWKTKHIKHIAQTAIDELIDSLQ